MKIIITESKFERLALNWLEDSFGHMDVVEVPKWPNHIFFMNNGKVMFDYNKDTSSSLVDKTMGWDFFISVFGLEPREIQYLLKPWIKKKYGLDIGVIMPPLIHPSRWKFVEGII